MRALRSTLVLFVLVAHPALGTDPDYVKRMEKTGAVTYEYDADIGPAETHAQTRFTIETQVKVSYKHTTRPAGRVVHVTIEPRIVEFTFEVRHTIRLPKQMEDESKRYGTLLYHEFDHVAISSDERPSLLFKCLVSKIGVIRKTLPAGTKIDNESVNKSMNVRIKAYEQAIVALIQANYDLLDTEDVSNHGIKPIADREAFFSSLYTRENLERVKFPYAKQVARFLKTPEYREAKTHYAY